MFSWLKRRNEDSTEFYKGDGIFIHCENCGGYHNSPQIPEFENAVKEACIQIGSSSDRLYETFRILDPEGRWDMLPDEGTFFFTNEDGRRCFADYSLVGSWIEETHSWMWGWNLPDTHITDATRKAPDLAHAIGSEKGWPCLTTPLLMMNECEAWLLTKFAASLAKYPLVYRAKVNEKAWAYFAIDTPIWET